MKYIFLIRSITIQNSRWLKILVEIVYYKDYLVLTESISEPSSTLESSTSGTTEEFIKVPSLRVENPHTKENVGLKLALQACNTDGKKLLKNRL